MCFTRLAWLMCHEIGTSAGPRRFLPILAVGAECEFEVAFVSNASFPKPISLSGASSAGGCGSIILMAGDVFRLSQTAGILVLSKRIK